VIDIDMLRSPCCRARLDAPGESLTCGACGVTYPVRTFGPDLMPPDAGERFETYPRWQAVQSALRAWRAQTWNGGSGAVAQTQRNLATASAFVSWAGIRGAVLDVGCGSGAIQSLVPATAFCGIDPMPLDQDYTFPFARAISDRLPFADGAFDACYFFSSIDYALSIETTLAEAYRVLKPGGAIAIGTPIHATKECEGEPLHHYRFLAGELDRLLAGASFTDVCTLAYQPAYHFLRARTGTEGRA
jgi:SAM-dependent methyltransferase